jgi:hypothetical protein
MRLAMTHLVWKMNIDQNGAYMSNLAHRNNRLALMLVAFFFFMFALSIVLGVIFTAGH